jgi:hypothetical protein
MEMAMAQHEVLLGGQQKPSVELNSLGDETFTRCDL